MGAEIIRLWVASTDYSGDLGIDDKILARVVDAYRRIRNTLRFLLANTSDFDAATDAWPTRTCWRSTSTPWPARPSCKEILATTRSTSSTPWSPSCSCSARKTWAASTWTCSRTASTPRRQEPGPPLGPDRAAPDHPGAAALDGALPVLHGRGSLEDRGPQRIHLLEKFTELPAGDEALLAKWTRIREIRDVVNKDIEAVRVEGKVGASLQAEVTISAQHEDLALLQSWPTT
jgi:isoleucyl-tRNA synthetase